MGQGRTTKHPRQKAAIKWGRLREARYNKRLAGQCYLDSTLAAIAIIACCQVGSSRGGRGRWFAPATLLRNIDVRREANWRVLPNE